MQTFSWNPSNPRPHQPYRYFPLFGYLATITVPVDHSVMVSILSLNFNRGHSYTESGELVSMSMTLTDETDQTLLWEVRDNQVLPRPQLYATQALIVFYYGDYTSYYGFRLLFSVHTVCLTLLLIIVVMRMTVMLMLIKKTKFL